MARIYFFIVPILLIALTSCKKHHCADNLSVDFGQGTGHCRIVSDLITNLLFADTIKYTVHYNSNDLPDIISVFEHHGAQFDTSRYICAYVNNSVVIYRYNRYGNLTSKDSVILNSDGQIAARYKYVGANDGHELFLYNPGTHNIDSINFISGNTVQWTQYFEWQNGDMVKDSMVFTNGNTYSNLYEYYPDKLFQYGSLSSSQDFFNNVILTFRPAHLHRRRNDSYDNYKFDSDGKVLVDTISSGSGVRYGLSQFSYECR